jgi:predicted AlkP superfamily phosphohydrolase/phosphomutase
MPSARLLVVGLDAADESLIREYAAAGDLPVISRLLETSATGETVAPAGLYVGAVWPSIYTGVSPASHGRYCFRQIVPGTYDTRRITTADVAVEPFWSGLSRAGRKVAVVDVPKSPLTPGVNGLQVVDWGTHDPDHDGIRTSPERLAGDLTARYGSDSVGNCNAFRHTADEYRDFEQQLCDRLERKTAMVSELLTLKPWDLFMVGFSEAHCVGHQCWHLRDESHPRYDENLSRLSGDVIRNVYRALDVAVGRVLDQAGPGTPAIVFSSHGLAPHYDANFMLEDMLLALESQKSVATTARVGHARRLWRAVPRWMRSPVSGLSGKARDRLALHPLAHRTAFQIPNNDAWGGIRINLAGREPNGRVSAGAEFDAVSERIADQLQAFVNCDTGKPVVSQIIRRSDFFSGPMEEHLPDLMVEWSREGPVSSVYSPSTGIVQGVYRKCRTGDHRPAGWYALSNMGLEAGPQPGPAAVMDYATTVSEYLGVSQPHLEGRSLIDLRRLAA